MKRLILYLLLICNLLPTDAQVRRIEQPDILFRHRKQFEVMAVELSDTATILDMRVNQKPNLWFMFGKDILLRDTLGRTWPILRLDSPYGGQLGDRIFAHDGGEIRVRLVFPPLPADVDNIDMTGEMPTETGTYGIRLDTLTWEQTEHLQRDSLLSLSPLDSLPVPEIRYGMAIVRGRLLNFRQGMLSHMVLHKSASWYYSGKTLTDTLHAAVTDDGRFEFRLPVTHIMPVMVGYEGRRLLTCYVAPDDTTELTADMYLLNLPGNRRRQKYSQQTNGPMAAVANELDHTQPQNNYMKLRKRVLDLHFHHPDFIGSNPKELLPLVAKLSPWIHRTRSGALRELMQLNDEVSLIALYQEELTSIPGYIKERGSEAVSMYIRRRKSWLKSVEADKMEAYLELLHSPKQLLCPAFMGVAHGLNGLPMLYPDYVDHEVNAFAMKEQLKDYQLLDTVQLSQNMATLPKAYQQWLQYYRQRLSQVISDNSQRTGYRIREDLPKVAEYHDFELLDKLRERYKGQTVFMHIWYPSQPQSREIIQKVIIPLQQEFAEHDITWVNLAYYSDHEDSWRNQAPLLLGDHYALATSYQPSAIRRQAMGKAARSPFLYLIITPDGKMVYKKDVPTNIEDLRRELEKYTKKK